MILSLPIESSLIQNLPIRASDSEAELDLRAQVLMVQTASKCKQKTFDGIFDHVRPSDNFVALSHDHKSDWCHQRGKIENAIFVIEIFKMTGLRIFIKLTELIKINFIRRLETKRETDWIWLSFQNLEIFALLWNFWIFSRCRKWILTWRHPSRIIKIRVSRDHSRVSSLSF